MRILNDHGDARRLRARRVAQLSRVALAIAIGVSGGAARPASATPANAAQPAPSAPHATADSAHAAKTESASGLIYWDGRRYRWYQRAD